QNNTLFKLARNYRYKWTYIADTSGPLCTDIYSCAIFKDLNGNPVGVVLTDREFDFGSTLRLPIEQYWIARKMKASSLSKVRVFVYNTIDHSYQAISFSDERIQYVLERSSQVINRVEVELQEIG
ncbi:hypothetical protein, partial [Sphingobacterium sp. BIGb0165]|uniref:hypothetical protein n=1 Tax=Sphingobacterium sp. BIGb0165 TaxID=2940615 RepID=UPI002168E63E